MLFVFVICFELLEVRADIVDKILPHVSIEVSREFPDEVVKVIRPTDELVDN